MRIYGVWYATEGKFFGNNNFDWGDIYIKGGILEFKGEITKKYTLRLENIKLVYKRVWAINEGIFWYLGTVLFLIFSIWSGFVQGYSWEYFLFIFLALAGLGIYGYAEYKDAQGPWIRITGTRKSGMRVDIFIRANGYSGSFGGTKKIYKRLDVYMEAYEAHLTKLEGA